MSNTKKITEKQKLFCLYYVTNDELRGNATLSYNEAFNMWLEEKDTEREKDWEWKDVPWTSEYDKCYNYCSMSSSRLLKKDKIQEENDRLWGELLNDAKINSRLSKIIYSGRDNDSISGIKVYNDITARLERAKQEALDEWKISEKVLDPLTARLKELWK